MPHGDIVVTHRRGQMVDRAARRTADLFPDGASAAPAADDSIDTRPAARLTIAFCARVLPMS